MTQQDPTHPDWLRETPSYSATEPTISSDPNGCNEREKTLPMLQRLQNVAAILSVILSPVAVILVGLWVSNKSMGGGGLSWAQGESGRVFNWHPVLMVTSYALMNIGVLIFRVSGTSSYQASLSTTTIHTSAMPAYPDSRNGGKRKIMKYLHATIWSLCFLFGVVALVAVFKSHNDPISGYIANLYSFHSWVGIFVLGLFTLQFLGGILGFSGLTESRRLASPFLFEIHKHTGTYIHIVVTATIMLGIQEKEGFVSCSYKVVSPDLFPLSNIGMIPSACKLSHSLGIVILGMGLFTNFALARLPVL